MVKQVINVGAAEGDPNSDPIRDAFIKINQNFTELFTNGIVGPVGPQGPSGPGVGAQGPKGYDGSIGPAGGPSGPQGPQGPGGPIGNKGYSGSRGTQGAQGAQGPQGVQGFDGSKGPQGPLGYGGSIGPPGGPQGPQGSIGFWGSSGPSGATGFWGSFGFTGFTGSRGIGFTGSKGTDGLPGSIGVTGYVGSASTIPGPSGPSGPTGNIGYNGSAGPLGPQGYYGSLGNKGFSGSAIGGGGTPGGSNTQVQYNNSGSFGGASAVTYNSVTNSLTIGPPSTGPALTVSGTVGVHSTKISDSAGNSLNAGYLEVPQNIQDANYTLIISDSSKMIYHSSASPHTWTIPSNASVAYPIGTVISFVNMGATVTIQITSDSLYYSGVTGSRQLLQYGMATIVKVDATTWMISGNRLT